MDRKESLLGMTLCELNKVASKLSLPQYTSKQLANWLYQKKIGTIDEMTNIAATKRTQLSLMYEIGNRPPEEKTVSSDGAIKYLFAVKNNAHYVESVYIPFNERATLCVSSQVGCRMNCRFCMTGAQRFATHLTANEMFNQIQSIPENQKLTNVVFMGMGEPLDNIDELFKVLDILTSPYGYGWSPKRITVSTIGLLPSLKRFLDECSCHLAVSLHSPYHEERLSLIPIEKIYPIKKIIDLLHNYDFSHQRRVTFEYILFDGINDTEQHARELARLLKGLECRVNLLRYHIIPNVKLTGSNEQKIEFFRHILNTLGVLTTIRTSRGIDVFAACGLLSTKKNNIK